MRQRLRVDLARQAGDAAQGGQFAGEDQATFVESPVERLDAHRVAREMAAPLSISTKAIAHMASKRQSLGPQCARRQGDFGVAGGVKRAGELLAQLAVVV